MASKPWFQEELERVTGEPWRVTAREGAMTLRCNHGMRVFVPYPPGLQRPFLNEVAERSFVGKVLPAHRPYADRAQHVGEVNIATWPVQ